MNIKWYKNRSNLIAKINKNNIILNSSCSKLINDFAYCIIGYNESEKFIIISPIGYSEIDNNEIEYSLFKINTTRTYSRISCTDFINEISHNYQLDFTNERKFEVIWNEKETRFEIDLKSEVNE